MVDLASKSICLTIFGILSLGLLIGSLVTPSWYRDSQTIISGGTAIGTFSWNGNLKQWCWGAGTYNGNQYSANCWNLVDSDAPPNPGNDPIIQKFLNMSAAEDGLRTLRDSSAITTAFIGVGLALIAVTIAVLLFAIFTHEFLYAHFALLGSKLLSLLVCLACMAAFLTYRISLSVAADDIVLTLPNGTPYPLIDAGGLMGGFVLVCAAFATSLFGFVANFSIGEGDLRAYKEATGASGAAAGNGQRGAVPVFDLRTSTLTNVDSHKDQNKNLPTWAARIMAATTPAHPEGGAPSVKREPRKTRAEREAEERRRARERLAAADSFVEGNNGGNHEDDSDGSPDGKKRKRSNVRSKSGSRHRYDDEDEEDERSDYEDDDDRDYDEEEDSDGSERHRKKKGRKHRSRSSKNARRRYHSSDEEEDDEKESVEEGVHRYGEEAGESPLDNEDDYRRRTNSRKKSQRTPSKKASRARQRDDDDDEAGEGKPAAVSADSVAVDVVDSDESPRKGKREAAASAYRAKQSQRTTASSSSAAASNKSRLSNPKPSSAAVTAAAAGGAGSASSVLGINGGADSDNDDGNATAFSPSSVTASGGVGDKNAYKSVTSLAGGVSASAATSSNGRKTPSAVAVVVPGSAAAEDSDEDERRSRRRQR